MNKQSILSKALELLNKGKSQRQIAKELSVARSTLGDWLRGDKQEGMQVINRPKTLLIDVETACAVVATFGRFKQNIGQDNVIEEGGFILTYTAKWLGDDLLINNHIKNKRDDYEMVKEIAELLDEADVVIAHNLTQFDSKMIKTRMLYHGMKPVTPFKEYDTLSVAKDVFRFPSNKLDSLGEYLEIGRKKSHSGIKLWLNVMNLEKEAIAEMMEYNDQDVILLEQLYEKIAPWSRKFPSIAPMYDDGKKHCPICGSTHLDEMSKTTFTQQSEFAMYRCSSCGKVARGKENLRSKESMKNTLMSVV